MYNVDHSPKIRIIAFHVQNSRKCHVLGKLKSVLEFASIKLGPGDAYNLLFGGSFEENVKK